MRVAIRPIRFSGSPASRPCADLPAKDSAPTSARAPRVMAPVRRRARTTEPSLPRLVVIDVKNERSVSPAEPAAGMNRSSNGRAAVMMVSPERSATFTPNSVCCGAINRTHTTPTNEPKSVRPTLPAGTVRGSVIMKYVKMRISGEVMMVSQRCDPHTGAKAQRAVKHCPDDALMAVPTVSVIQNATTVERSPSLRVTSDPPMRMTAYAMTIARFERGAHQKSSGSTRLLPSTRNAHTNPTFDGLNTCEPLRRTTNLVSSDAAAMPEKIHHLWNVQWSPTGVLGTLRMSAMPLPVSMALAGHTNDLVSWNVMATWSNAVVRIAARIWGTLTWNPSPTWPSVCSVRTTAATCSRESRMRGRTTG